MDMNSRIDFVISPNNEMTIPRIMAIVKRNVFGRGDIVEKAKN